MRIFSWNILEINTWCSVQPHKVNRIYDAKYFIFLRASPPPTHHLWNKLCEHKSSTKHLWFVHSLTSYILTSWCIWNHVSSMYWVCFPLRTSQFSLNLDLKSSSAPFTLRVYGLTIWWLCYLLLCMHWTITVLLGAVICYLCSNLFLLVSSKTGREWQTSQRLVSTHW